MDIQVHPEPNTCWVSTLATLSGIDVELFQHDLALAPEGYGFMYISIEGHVERTSTILLNGMEEWRDMLRDNGYRLVVSQNRRESGTQGVMVMLVHEKYNSKTVFHAMPVDEDGYLHSLSEADAPLDKERLDNLHRWCNVVVVNYFWLEEV